jgi:hypothetical protein
MMPVEALNCGKSTALASKEAVLQESLKQCVRTPLKKKGTFEHLNVWMLERVKVNGDTNGEKYPPRAPAHLYIYKQNRGQHRAGEIEITTDHVAGGVQCRLSFLQRLLTEDGSGTKVDHRHPAWV